jgi:hypothetical protein
MNNPADNSGENLLELSDSDIILKEEDKRIFCALMLKKYGVSLSLKNEFLPMYYMAYMSTLVSERTSKESEENMRRIIGEFEKKAANTIIGVTKVASDFEKNAVSKISKIQTNQIHISNPKEAFWYGMGRFGFLSCFVATLLFVGFLMVFFSQKTQEYNLHATTFLDKAGLRQADVDKINTVHFISLTPVTHVREAEAGKNYVYDEACKCIQVPIYYQIKK